MCWGFQHGDGWYDLIDCLSGQLTRLAAWEGVLVPQASTVKEKYGTLRFYCCPTTDIMSACIAAAERQSAHTCEQCGATQTARVRGGYWRSCRCAKCTHADGGPIASWEAKSLGLAEGAYITEKEETE